MSKIGVGGMGEIYKALDTSLDRYVALKILPADLVRDPDRVRRFVQEAKAASALNHPNIVTIHEIGQVESESNLRTKLLSEISADSNSGSEFDKTLPAEPVTPSRIHYITMEYIDGHTLRTKIHEEKVDLKRLLEYMIQVAEGLVKAHGAGIIHRDLKPDNIMITRDGFAKILDFGLAKLVEPSRPLGDENEAAAQKTRSGVVMGTANYMSPEQAQGKPLDQRSDIFSFGCILYEVAAGRKPFEGDSLIDTMHRIVYAEAPPITGLNPSCPSELQRIARKALAKDPEARYQSIKEVAIDLRELVRDLRSGTHTTVEKKPESSDFIAGGMTEKIPLKTALYHFALPDDDPRVTRVTRFTKGSLTLSVLAALSFIVIWPAFRYSNVGSELKVETPRVAALNKAREICGGFGYDTSGLESHIAFQATDLDLKEVARSEGQVRVREAIQGGYAAAWRIAYVRPGEGDFKGYDARLKPGEVLLSIDSRGRLTSFTTPPLERGDAESPEQSRAVEVASRAVQSLLGIDVGAFDLEFIKRSNPPGVSEITWRDPNPVYGQNRVVRVVLQGERVTTLSRALEAPQAPGPDAHGELLSFIRRLQAAIIILTILAAYCLGVVFLVRTRRWDALRRKLPMAVCGLFAGGVFVIYLSASSGGIEDIAGGLIVTVVGAVAFYPAFAGFFEWLRDKYPERLYGADHLAEGRVTSKYVSASLIQGVIGGVVATGVVHTLETLLPLFPGYLPTITDIVDTIERENPFITLVLALIASLLLVSLIVLLTEAVERVVKNKFLATLLPALLPGLMGLDLEQTNIPVLLVNYATVTLGTLIVVYFYRTRGFAAAWVLYLTYFLLDEAVNFRSVGEPAFITSSNLMILSVLGLLAVGLFKYMVGRRALGGRGQGAGAG